MKKSNTETYLDTGDISHIIINRIGDKIDVTWWDKEGYYHAREFWPSIDADRGRNKQ